MCILTYMCIDAIHCSTRGTPCVRHRVHLVGHNCNALNHNAKNCNTLRQVSCLTTSWATLPSTSPHNLHTYRYTDACMHIDTHIRASTKGAPGGREDRAAESTNTECAHAVGALHAHAVARHVDGELCAVVAASRHLVVPIVHSICVERGDAIGHLHAPERIARHL